MRMLHAIVSRLLLRCIAIAFASGLVAVHGQEKKGGKKAPSGITDQQIVEQAVLVAKGRLVDVYQFGLTVDPAFVSIADEAYQKLEQLTGRRFDTATLGKVRVYVSAATGPAHVWRGYQHYTDPKGIVFLNRRVYEGALTGQLSTHVTRIGASADLAFLESHTAGRSCDVSRRAGPAWLGERP